MSRVTPLVLALVSLVFTATSANAGTTTITTETEKGGNICIAASGDGCPNNEIWDNTNGTVFWNGSTWQTDSTAAHMYFLSLITGKKLSEFNSTAVSTSLDNLGNVTYVPGPQGMVYAIYRRLYTYRKLHANQATYPGVKYRYDALEYEIRLEKKDTPGVSAGKRMIARSRGTGNTTEKAYLDIYFENEDGTIEALLGDPAWYHFSGVSLEQAVEAGSAGGELKGYLPTLSSQYFFDFEGGSELGGRSYAIETGTFDSSQVSTKSLAQAFAVTVKYQYTDAESYLREIVFRPVIVTEALEYPKATTEGLCAHSDQDCIHQQLDSYACAGANGFLGQTNIASVINLLSSPLTVQVDYYDLAGTPLGQAKATIGANLKKDFIINDLGLAADTVGTVCVLVDGPSGSWTGGIAIYKPDFRSGTPSFGEAFDFALYYPFLNPNTGNTAVPLNTFHLGTSPSATVANWIAVIDAQRDGLPLVGKMEYYDEAGAKIKEEAVKVPDGGRRDYSGHEGLAGKTNLDAVGMAKFVPDELPDGQNAPYYLTLTRYFYDCVGSGCNNFLTAFNIPFRPGAQMGINGGVSTTDNEIAIIELNNVTKDGVSASVQVSAADGTELGQPTIAVPGMGTRHLIINKSDTSGYLSADQIGAATVQANGGSLSASSLFYKLNDQGGLVYAYAAPFVASPGARQVSQFNSFIQHSSSPELYNSTSQTVNVLLTYIDVAGTTVYTNNFAVSPQATARWNAIPLPADTFGTIIMQASASGVVFRNYVSRKDVYTLSFPGE